MSTHFKKIFKENKKRADKTARKALKLLCSLIYFLCILFGEHFIILERLVLIEQFVRIGGIEADILAECIAQPVFGNNRIFRVTFLDLFRRKINFKTENCKEEDPQNTVIQFRGRRIIITSPDRKHRSHDRKIRERYHGAAKSIDIEFQKCNKQ